MSNIAERLWLYKEKQEFTLALCEQWQMNHSEHCRWEWPHAGICHWPIPTLLVGYVEQLLEEAKTT